MINLDSFIPSEVHTPPHTHTHVQKEPRTQPGCFLVPNVGSGDNIHEITGISLPPILIGWERQGKVSRLVDSVKRPVYKAICRMECATTYGGMV